MHCAYAKQPGYFAYSVYSAYLVGFCFPCVMFSVQGILCIVLCTVWYVEYTVVVQTEIFEQQHLSTLGVYNALMILNNLY